VFADEQQRDEMAQGWRFQLSLFGNLVANDLHAGASTAVDGWLRRGPSPTPSSAKRCSIATPPTTCDSAIVSA
jgi:hypothetical protein